MAKKLRSQLEDIIEQELEECRKAMLRLAADFLEAYADRLGNDGCNDWHWPDGFPDAAMMLLTDEAYREDFDGGAPPNWMAVRRLAAYLRRLA